MSDDAPAIGLSLRADHPGFSLDKAVELSKTAEANGFHSVWRSESSGLNAFFVLQHIASRTTSIKLGTGIVNVFSRSPMLLAMSAATMDLVSDNRTIMGLGVSTKPLVESWHGLEFEQPLTRIQEAAQIINQAYEHDSIEFNGDIFDIGPYPIEFETPRDSIPIFSAAMGPKHRHLCAKYADGWLPAFQPIEKLEDYIDDVQAGAKSVGRNPSDITIAPYYCVSVAADPERSERQVREFLAKEMGMGYNRLVGKYGYGDEADTAYRHWQNGERDRAADSFPEEMVDEFAIFGTRDEVSTRLRELGRKGVDLLVATPPFSASMDDIEQTMSAISPSEV
jgi:alkanesulfonate monooxygenase SsuD/methylene tetrahydromethanopterin reductase-like flavin-dependent oxidoreductase (luciferase family)